ncbi:histidine ammonia-lyase, partial [Kitasatospora sp. NPDC036755]
MVLRGRGRRAGDGRGRGAGAGGAADGGAERGPGPRRALINGTDGMLGMLVMAIADLQRLFTTADI